MIVGRAATSVMIIVIVGALTLNAGGGFLAANAPIARETTASLGSVATEPDGSSALVNLLGQTTVSPSLIYDGFYNTGDNAFPVLLTGAASNRFWSTGQSVLELAPSLSFGHDAGVVLFSSSASSNVTLSAVAAPSATYESGDGIELYFLMTPTHATNWSTPYYATDPEGGNGTFTSPQGSVIFPYSAGPYIALQWDPGFGEIHSLHLYTVTPGLGGVVSRSTIHTINVGAGNGSIPSAGSYVTLTASYNLGDNTLTGSVEDYANGTVLSSFSQALSTLDFNSSFSAASSYYFGAGGSGNSPDGWALLSLSIGAGSTSPSSSSGSSWILPLIGVLAVAVALGALAVVVIRRGKGPVSTPPPQQAPSAPPPR